MVSYGRTFFYALLWHLFILIMVMASTRPLLTGNDNNQIIHAELFHGGYSREQVQAHQVNQSSQVKTSQKKVRIHSESGVNKIKNNANKLPVAMKEARFKRAFSTGQRDALLLVIHDVIARNQYYPEQASFLNETGMVTVGFRMGPSGVVRAVKILSGSGFSALDVAAIKTMNHLPAILKAADFIHKPEVFKIRIHFD
jgi:TonB family protein